MTLPTLDVVLATLRAHEPELRAMHVQSLHVFGSVARGDAHENSDVDLLVEFDRGVGLFHLAGVHLLLEDMLGRKVDLVMRAALVPAFRDDVLREAVRAA